MYQLNPVSTRIFTRLLDKMQKEKVFDIRVPHNSTLRMTSIGKVVTPAGKGRVIGMGRISSEKINQYSAFMEFVVIDCRRSALDRGQVKVFPRLYRDDVNDVEEEAVILEGGKVKYFKSAVQCSLVKFAFGWLVDMVTEGY